ncbi:MAG: BamA/TamA family outer membrane protein [Bryobacteraceae bacterium]|nr:BamA/TamA family outer membrane protein [Bryobacteraceae bacterium]
MPRSSLLLIGIFACCASAQTPLGLPVRSLRFEPAQQPLPEAELRALLPVRTGDPLTAPLVRQTIADLYKTNRFDTIHVEGEVNAGQVDVIIRTTPNWFIGRVVIEGVPDPPSIGQLNNSTKLDLGALYEPGQVNQAVEGVANTLRLNGFYESRIQQYLRRDPETQTISVLFQVAPGPRARLSRPELLGNLAQSPRAIIRASRWPYALGLFAQTNWGWKGMSQSRIQNGVDRIRRTYIKKNFLMATTALEAVRYQPETRRVQPVLRIDAGAPVAVRTTGAKLSPSRLRQLTPIYQEASVDRALLLEGARGIEQYFQAAGYFDVEVGYGIDDQGGQRTIDYNIARGDRYKLVSLQLDGYRYFNQRTLLERMQTTPATWLRYRHGRYSERMLAQDRLAIEELYRTNGFLEVEVQSRVQPAPQGKPFEQAVYLTVKEGEQWLIGQVDLEGVKDERAEYLRSILQSQPGQPYSEAGVAADRDVLLNEFFNNGFPGATVDGTVEIDKAQRRVAVKFAVQEGRQQFIRKVIVEGLEATNQELVTSRLRLAEGDPVSQGNMLATQRRLYDLGIFSRVDMALQNPDGAEASKYVLYQVEEARKYSFTFGAGAQIARIGGGIRSFDSPAGGTGFSPRILLGLSRGNVFGVGHTASIQTRVSNLQNRVIGSYLAPQFRNSDKLNLIFTALYDDSRDVRTFNARRREASVQLGQRLSRATTVQYRLTYRRVAVDETTLKIEPQLIPLLSQPVRLGIASLTFIQDRRDDPLDAKRGWYNTLDSAFSSRALTSQSDFLRFLGRNSSYYKIGRDLVFARTLTFGWQYGLSENPTRDVPLPERFFTGGANSHRGFSENQAGPRDLVTGFPVGGKAVMINGLELRFPLVGDNLSGVLFHDAGNVYTNFNKISFRASQRNIADFNYMVHTVGFGVRYRTPVGPIRVDVGYSPNSPRFQGFQGTFQDLLFQRGVATRQRVNQFAFHFSLGQAF